MNLAREIPGWPGYVVSESGRVFSLARTVGDRTLKGRELAQFDRMKVVRSGRKRLRVPTGCRSVTLSRDGKHRTLYVHALVMLAFEGPYPSDDHEVLHGDGNRANNARSNLRYGTVLENLDDREAHGNVLRGARHGRAVHSVEKIRAIKARIARGEGDTAIARALGVNHGTVNHIRNGKQWSHVAA